MDLECDIQGILELLQQILQGVVLLDSVKRVSEEVFNCLSRAHNVLSRDNIGSCANANVSTGSVGRPSFETSKEQIEFLLDCNFKVQEISEILNV